MALMGKWHLLLVKLKPNLVELDGEIEVVDLPNLLKVRGYTKETICIILHMHQWEKDERLFHTQHQIQWRDLGLLMENLQEWQKTVLLFIQELQNSTTNGIFSTTMQRLQLMVAQAQ